MQPPMLPAPRMSLPISIATNYLKTEIVVCAFISQVFYILCGINEALYMLK